MADSLDHPDSGEETKSQKRDSGERILPGSVTREAIRQRLAGHLLDDVDSKNLLVCFMNEEASDDESTNEDDLVTSNEWDIEGQQNLFSFEKLSSKDLAKNNISKRKGQIIIPLRCALNNLNSSNFDCESPNDDSEASQGTEENKNGLGEKLFFDKLAAIQLEACCRLRDAKSLALRRVESERHSQQMNSEIHKMLGIKPGSKLNRSILTSMTVGQLQFILNSLLSQIEILNEDLVQYLITRDELAIEQDSLLTDIEDITKCINGGRKEKL